MQANKPKGINIKDLPYVSTYTFMGREYLWTDEMADDVAIDARGWVERELARRLQPSLVEGLNIKGQ